MKNVLFEISNNADQAFDSLIASSGGKLTWDKGTIPTTKQSGTAVGAQPGRTAKVDIISNGLFILGLLYRMVLQLPLRLLLMLQLNGNLLNLKISILLVELH